MVGSFNKGAGMVTKIWQLFESCQISIPKKLCCFWAIPQNGYWLVLLLQVILQSFFCLATWYVIITPAPQEAEFKVAQKRQAAKCLKNILPIFIFFKGNIKHVKVEIVKKLQ